jgi:ionotropic glutamate receptor NMDA 1
MTNGDSFVCRKLQAFIWDSSRLEYEAGQNCELITVGDLFGRSGLGVGLQKKSPWTSKISMAILKLHESMNMFVDGIEIIHI